MRARFVSTLSLHGPEFSGHATRLGPPVAVSNASKRDIESPTTLTLLVEAERRWRDALGQTDRECAALVARSREALDSASRDLERELTTLVEERRREISNDVDRRIAQIRGDAHARAMRLRGLDAAAIDALVELVLARVAWPEDVP